MTNKCVYCKESLADERVISVCDNCGLKVWGQKMFIAIQSSATQAKEKGDIN
jgi:uncharacterized UBP type Zn finger protein